MMEGLPGSGKSTLAKALERCVREAGAAVELLPEEAIFRRAEFARVGRAFRNRVWPAPRLMLEAYDRVFAAARDAHRSVISDWNSVAMIEDLPCAHPDRSTTTSNDPSVMPDEAVLIGHATDVRHAWAAEALLLVLELPPEKAIERAAQERGVAWLEREANRGALELNGSAFERAVRFHDAFRPRRRAVVDAHERGGWTVVRLDASHSEDVITHSALRAVVPDA